ncbi:MAG: hypothetical protein H6Q78_1274 [Candidatus Krumholzibacteriota bacterium]|nr:hypothetical protein [Candidatus Krumholzibacteriota bacterium]
MAATYREIVVRGDGKLLKGFIRGYQIGHATESGIFFCADHPIDTRRLRERLTLRGDHVHLMCKERLRQSFLAAIQRATDLEFELVSDEKVSGASFEFEFDTYSRKVGSEIKNLLENLPEGLEVADYAPEETVDAKARGAELYSPVHEYRFQGKGKIAGDFERLLDFHAALAANAFVEARDISIEH